MYLEHPCMCQSTGKAKPFSFTLYMRHPGENTNNRKACQLSAQLMDSVVYLSQNTNLIHHIHLFCNKQIVALEKLQKEKVETEKQEIEI